MRAGSGEHVGLGEVWDAVSDRNANRWRSVDKVPIAIEKQIDSLDLFHFLFCYIVLSYAVVILLCCFYVI